MFVCLCVLGCLCRIMSDECVLSHRDLSLQPVFLHKNLAVNDNWRLRIHETISNITHKHNQRFYIQIDSRFGINAIDWQPKRKQTKKGRKENYWIKYVEKSTRTETDRVRQFSKCFHLRRRLWNVCWRGKRATTIRRSKENGRKRRWKVWWRSWRNPAHWRKWKKQSPHKIRIPNA